MNKLIILISLLIISIYSSGQRYLRTRNLNVIDSFKLANNRATAISDNNGTLATTLYVDDYFLSETSDRTIYVDSLGNDITGDGSSSYPFKTLKRAIQDIAYTIDAGVTITIDIDTTYHILASDEIDGLQDIAINGTIQIVGKLRTLETGLTFARDASDRFLSDITGLSMTYDQYVDKFVYKPDDDNLYPIARNTTDQVLTPNEWDSWAGYTDIAEIQTIFQADETFRKNFNVLGTGVVIFKYIYFIFNNFNNRLGNDNENGVNFNIKSCFLDGTNISTTNNNLINANKKQIYNNCIFLFDKGTFIDYRAPIALGNDRTMSRCVVRNKATSFSVAYWPAIRSENDPGLKMRSVIIRNFPFAICLSNVEAELERSLKTFDVGCIFRVYTGGGEVKISTPWLVSMDSTEYIFMSRYASSNINISLPSEVVYGAPTVANRVPKTATYWKGALLQQSTLGYEMWRPLKNITILLPNEYPEMDVNIEETLTDNSTTYINIGDSLTSKSVIIEYTAIRSTDIEVNRLEIINKQSSVSLNEETLIGDDIGVSFAVDFNGGLIRLGCTLTSTGYNAYFKYNVFRIMY